jgi:ADP-ribose pyrophosphatase YjhB (NUDIX family)
LQLNQNPTLSMRNKSKKTETLATPERNTPKTTVVAIIKKIIDGNDFILLTQRKVAPYKDMWCLPGGHIEHNEIAFEAIIREVKEETGLDFKMEFYNYFDEIIPEEKIHAVVLIYVGTAIGELQKNNDEVKDATWVLLHNTLKYDLAFQHKELIKKYIDSISDQIGNNVEAGLLEELKYLRSEIENRFETRDKMIYYAIFLAAGVLAFHKIEGYILYPVLGTILAGLWSHSDIRIHDIAQYIKTRIEPNVKGLFWENYLFEKYKYEKVAKARRQETYVLWVYTASYLMMIFLSIFYILPIILNGVHTQKNKIDLILTSVGIIITSFCIYKTRKYIKTRRNNFNVLKQKE